MFIVLAFGAGTWVGARGIDLKKEAEARIESGVNAVKHIEVGNVNVDGAHLPDPLPWPRLNPECTIHRAWLLAEGPADPTHRLVTLTFDDGPTNDVTPAVLDVLAKHHAHATFFFVGQNYRGTADHVKGVKAVTQRVLDRGHLIGSHTKSHALLPQIDHARQLAEIDEGIDIVGNVTGKKPVLFRPPYGQLDAYGEDALRARGLELVMWSVEADAKIDAESMFASMRDQIAYAGGGIVLMHDTRPATAIALGKLLDWLEWKKYEVVDLPTYLRETAAHPQPYPDRSALEKARAATWRSNHPAFPKLDEGA